MKTIADWLRRHILRIGVAWVVGCIGYVVIVIVSGSWAGIESFMCQPAISVCPSTLCVLLAIIVGLPLSVPSIRRLWSKALVLNIALLIAGFVLLLFSQALGLNAQLLDPNTNDTYYVGSHPVAVTLSYFLLVFSIVNWPFKPTLTVQDGEAIEQERSASEQDWVHSSLGCLALRRADSTNGCRVASI